MNFITVPSREVPRKDVKAGEFPEPERGLEGILRMSRRPPVSAMSPDRRKITFSRPRLNV
jgi:hypothetical protein